MELEFFNAEDFKKPPTEIDGYIDSITNMPLRMAAEVVGSKKQLNYLKTRLYNENPGLFKISHFGNKLIIRHKSPKQHTGG